MTHPSIDAANLMTFSRLPLAFTPWLRPRSDALLLASLFAAALTDVFDGWIARRLPGHSQETGAWLDPLCDKAFVLSILLFTWRANRTPSWVPATIALREIIQIPLLAIYCLNRRRLRARVNLDMKAAPIGKIATGTQLLALGAILVRHRSMRPLSVLAGVTGASAAAYYFRRAVAR